MKDSLLEKLLDLFDECLNKQTTSPSFTHVLNRTTPTGGENMEKIDYLESNTCFVRDAKAPSKRVFTEQECMSLSKKSVQFLEHLVQLNLIGDRTLELIINQLVLIPFSRASLQETKWIIHSTLADSLDPDQLAFLDLILYSQEDQARCH